MNALSRFVSLSFCKECPSIKIRDPDRNIRSHPLAELRRAPPRAHTRLEVETIRADGFVGEDAPDPQNLPKAIELRPNGLTSNDKAFHIAISSYRQ